MIMTIIVTIELPVDPDKVTSVDVINRIKELIETDSLYFRWEKDEVPSESMWSDWNETLSGAVSKWEDKKWEDRHE
tara:strand:- start:193 stop:420 length:228 start_codon:yes stop_codon:yes gene_type:complete